MKIGGLRAAFLSGNVRIRENLPFNVHLLDVVFAAEPAVPVRQSVLPRTADCVEKLLVDPDT